MAAVDFHPRKTLGGVGLEFKFHEKYPFRAAADSSGARGSLVGCYGGLLVMVSCVDEKITRVV